MNQFKLFFRLSNISSLNSSGCRNGQSSSAVDLQNFHCSLTIKGAEFKLFEATTKEPHKEQPSDQKLCISKYCFSAVQNTSKRVAEIVTSKKIMPPVR